eukprot:gene2966-12974_t
MAAEDSPQVPAPMQGQLLPSSGYPPQMPAPKPGQLPFSNPVSACKGGGGSGGGGGSSTLSMQPAKQTNYPPSPRLSTLLLVSAASATGGSHSIGCTPPPQHPVPPQGTPNIACSNSSTPYDSSALAAFDSLERHAVVSRIALDATSGGVASHPALNTVQTTATGSIGFWGNRNGGNALWGGAGQGGGAQTALPGGNCPPPKSTSTLQGVNALWGGAGHGKGAQTALPGGSNALPGAMTALEKYNQETRHLEPPKQSDLPQHFQTKLSCSIQTANPTPADKAPHASTTSSAAPTPYSASSDFLNALDEVERAHGQQPLAVPPGQVWTTGGLRPHTDSPLAVKQLQFMTPVAALHASKQPTTPAVASVEHPPQVRDAHASKQPTTPVVASVEHPPQPTTPAVASVEHPPQVRAAHASKQPTTPAVASVDHPPQRLSTSTDINRHQPTSTDINPHQRLSTSTVGSNSVPSSALARHPVNCAGAGHERGTGPGQTSGTEAGHAHGTEAGHGSGTGPGHASGTEAGHARGTEAGRARGTEAGHGSGTGPGHASGINAGHGSGTGPGHTSGTGAGHARSTEAGKGSGTGTGHASGSAAENTHSAKAGNGNVAMAGKGVGLAAHPSGEVGHSGHSKQDPPPTGNGGIGQIGHSKQDPPPTGHPTHSILSATHATHPTSPLATYLAEPIGQAPPDPRTPTHLWALPQGEDDPMDMDSPLGPPGKLDTNGGLAKTGAGAGAGTHPADLNIEDCNPEALAAAIAAAGPASRQLESYLPKEICQVYRSNGMTHDLYEWQGDCLCQPGVLQGRNLVYCAPTSGGKSLVAEVLSIRRLLTSGKPFLLVLPFVSLCAEKAAHLEKLLKPMSRTVKAFYGGLGSGTVMSHDTGAIVCTIEKANMLVNKMLEEDSLGQLGALVVDELHMVGDDERGYLLELLLTKLRYATTTASDALDADGYGEASQEGLQVIGMSATMPNLKQVAHWLGAELYETDFRPVQLMQYLKVGKQLCNANMDVVRELNLTKSWETKDPEHVAFLCNETVQNTCESVAKHVVKVLGMLPERRTNIPISPGKTPREMVADEMSRLPPAAQDSALSAVLPFERELVESAYKCGAVSVLCATSTLAAGVNLPARRVIFRHPYIGIPSNPLDATRYRQMSWRVGRADVDDHRESISITTEPTHNVKFNRLQHWLTVLSLPCRYRPMSGHAGRAGIDDLG